jgi:nucleoside-diphosphate-sugar epimerase
VAQADGLTGVVNIGSGKPTSLGEVAHMLAGIAGAPKSGLGSLPDRAGDPPLLVPDTSRLAATGWTPSRSLHAGLAETLEWWRDLEREPEAAAGLR